VGFLNLIGAVRPSDPDHGNRIQCKSKIHNTIATKKRDPRGSCRKKKKSLRKLRITTTAAALLMKRRTDRLGRAGPTAFKGKMSH
jgi:hypothetical protein